MKTVKGNFIWKDGIMGGTVIFKECADGKFTCGFNPPKKKE
jgi:hypothetical protein